MEANRRVWVVATLAASIGLWGCLNKPPVTAHGPGLTKQDDLVMNGANAPAGTLKLTIQDRRPISAGYKVNYIPVQEWNKARFTLDKVTATGATDATFTAITSGPSGNNNDPSATIDATTLTRTATYSFSGVTPASGYRLKVELIRMEGGTERVIASGVNAGSDGTGFIISTGANTVNVLISLTPVNGGSPTSGGRPVVTIPQPASTGGGAGATPTPSPNTLANTTTTNSSFSLTHFAGANSSTFNAPNTLASTALYTAGSLEMGPDGTVYVACPNFNRILSLNTATGSNVVAGTGAAAYNYDAVTNNQATTNNINNPNGMSIDPINNVLYLCDGGNNVIRKIVGGVISDVAGRGATATITNGTSLATGVTISSPQDIEVDADGSLYFTDNGNGRVCRVTPSDGKIYTVASVTTPRSIVLDRINKTLYVASGNSIKSVTGYDVTTSYPYTPTNVITFVANATPTTLFGGNTWATKYPNYTYTVAALAYDYMGTLYAAVNQTSTTAYQYNSLTRVPVTAGGALQSGRTTEVIGGWNNLTGVPTYYTGSISNITTTQFDATGGNGLVMDLRNAASTTDPANTLYWLVGLGAAYQGNLFQLTLNAL
jgi:hypothetical protein